MKIAEVSEKYNLPQDTLRYYEKVGVIPLVGRNPGGSREYGEDDCKWIELAQCLRGAGLPVEAIIEYRRLFDIGDSTIPDRLKLLEDQHETLVKQKEATDRALERLEYKISRYKVAVETGVLSWDEQKCDKND